MPNWNEISKEIGSSASPLDSIRRKYLKELSDLTGRNTIIYYSGFLQNTELSNGEKRHLSVNDNDKTGFMSTIFNMDKSKGLDLILHTPGGDIAATESLVNYLKAIFGNDIRAIVPQLAMSAGTMISCSCSTIIMGKHSSIGPIDPQLGPYAAHAIIEEFVSARKDILKEPKSAALWSPIISKYSPTLIGKCQKAISWSEEIVKNWLISNMLSEHANKEDEATNIVKYLGSHAMTKSHSRHISADKAREIGLNITMLEEDSALQEAVLSVHHSTIHTLTSTKAIKIIENNEGMAYIQSKR